MNNAGLYFSPFNASAAPTAFASARRWRGSKAQRRKCLASPTVCCRRGCRQEPHVGFCCWHSSAVERHLGKVEVQGSIPCASFCFVGPAVPDMSGKAGTYEDLYFASKDASNRRRPSFRNLIRRFRSWLREYSNVKNRT